jgi:hypothetical protein
LSAARSKDKVRYDKILAAKKEQASFDKGISQLPEYEQVAIRAARKRHREEEMARSTKGEISWHVRCNLHRVDSVTVSHT